MAERAGDADARGTGSVPLVERLDAHDRIRLEQLERRLDVVEVGRAAANRGHGGSWELVEIDLEAELQRLSRREAGSHSAVPLAGDGAMELERVAPEILVAKRVVTEDISALLQHRGGALANVAGEGIGPRGHRIVLRDPGRSGLPAAHRHGHEQHGSCDCNLSAIQHWRTPDRVNGWAGGLQAIYQSIDW